VVIRLVRWFGILDERVKAIGQEGSEASVTVSVDAVDLLDDITEAMEVCAVFDGLSFV
jgi:hypothetical protein